MYMPNRKGADAVRGNRNISLKLVAAHLCDQSELAQKADSSRGYYPEGEELYMYTHLRAQNNRS